MIGQQPRRARAGLLAGLILLILVPVVLTGRAASAATAPIAGGGSSFAALEIDQWRANTARSPFNLNVNYVAQGSSFGRQEFIANNLDFGASDIVMQGNEPAQLAQSGRCGGQALANCFVYVPVSAGGVSFMYNLVGSDGQRISNLNLTRTAACGIFTGAISKWNDPRIVQTNPELAGFNQSIIPIIRSDGAGESFVLSQFCIAVDPTDWATFVAQQGPLNGGTPFAAGQPTSNWPEGWGRSQAVAQGDGVANVVADPEAGQNAITYTAAGYAVVRNFPVASVQNAAGVFTQPDNLNVNVALGYASPQNDPATNTVGTFAIAFNGGDPRAYFPSTYSYILAQTSGFSPAKGAALGQFLCYAISVGQEIAPELKYAQLSAPIVQIAINAISKIPGAPPPSQCFLAGAPAPPPPPGLASGLGAAALANANANAACPPTSTASTTTTTAAASKSATTTTTTKPTPSTTTTTAKGATTTTTVPCLSSSANGSAKLASELASQAGNTGHGNTSTTETAVLTLVVGAGAVAAVTAGRRRWGVG